MLGYRPIDFELAIDHYATLEFTVHKSYLPFRQPLGANTIWPTRHERTCVLPVGWNAVLIIMWLCDLGIIHTQKYYKTEYSMQSSSDRRPTQEFPWQTFPRFYRPWRLRYNQLANIPRNISLFC